MVFCHGFPELWYSWRHQLRALADAGFRAIAPDQRGYGETDCPQPVEAYRVRELVKQHDTGFLYAANFSVGVNIFLDMTHAAAAALRHDYYGQIFERHHVHKKDAPSGTAIVMQNILRETSGIQQDVEITSFREGEVVGLHEIVLESKADRIYLCHDAKSRRGFAEGAVLGAEWLSGKKGFYEFKDIWREL